MKINLTAHIKQHAGDILLECQDSFDYNLDNLTFAVSDGVSQAFRPELWSRILTSAYVNNPESFFVKNGNGLYEINTNLGLKKEWNQEVNKAYEKASPQERFLLDLKRESVNIGAATFIGIKLESNGIKFFAIGDSVLFFYDYETKELKTISSMIPENGDIAFNNSPEYIDSNEKCNGNIISGILPYKKGILFLATDALSDWIVERRGLNIQETFKTLMQIPDHETYDKFIDDIRTESQPKKLKDDDTTFVALEICDSDGNMPEITLNYAIHFNDLLLNETINDLRNKTEELDSLKSGKFDLERKLKKRDKEFDLLLSEKESQFEELTKCKQEIAALQQTKRDLESEKDELKRDLSTSKSQVASLSQKKKSLESDNDRLESANKRLTNDLSASRTEQSKLLKEKKLLEDQVKKKETTSSSTPTKKDSADLSEISRLQNELNQNQARLQQAQRELDLLRSQIGYIKSSYDSDGRTYVSDLIKLFNMTFGESQVVGEIYIESIPFKKTKDGGFEIL